MIQTRPVRLHLKVSTGRAVWYSIIGDSSALSVRSFAITSLIEKPCCRDNPRGGLEPTHIHFTWLVYQNRCFQWLGPMLQRRLSLAKTLANRRINSLQQYFQSLI